MTKSMLTTIDNPFNPFTQFDEWYAYDVGKGYHTCAYLARITVSSEELSEEDESVAIEAAINEILEINVLGLYKKIVEDESIETQNEDSIAQSEEIVDTGTE
jgi:hypothetical protein